jgi:predicted Rossmann fold flavoprotein
MFTEQSTCTVSHASVSLKTEPTTLQELFMSDIKQVIIIGAGASGLMAGIMAARGGAAVTILEKEKKPGRKLLRTGNGKCNLTNTGDPRHAYHGTDPGFAARALDAFSVQDTIRFFTEIGLYTTSKDGWIYPYAGQAESVLACLLREAAKLRIKIKNNETVTAVTKKDNHFDVQTSTWTYRADSVILACGTPASLVKSQLPCNGLTLAESLGHSTVPQRPSLVPLVCEGAEKKGWAGVRIQGTCSLWSEGIMLASETGQLQLTEQGVSGIPVFNISGRALILMGGGLPVTLKLDFFPDFDREMTQAFLESRRILLGTDDMKSILTGLFPEKLIPALISGAHNIAELTENIKACTLFVKGSAGAGSAQVMSGGIRTYEVDAATSESRICPGLFITGELLDIDGACGGWNLQLAWSTGANAGRHAAD